MESNMEARYIPTHNNKTEPRFVPVNISSKGHPFHSSNIQSYAFRPNGSLPRKFHANTNIPIRNDFYNFSQGTKYFNSIEN